MSLTRETEVPTILLYVLDAKCKEAILMWDADFCRALLRVAGTLTCRFESFMLVFSPIAPPSNPPLFFPKRRTVCRNYFTSCFERALCPIF